MHRHFLRVFVPSALIALALTSYIYRKHYLAIKEEIRIENQSSVERFSTEVAQRCVSIGRGILRLSHQIEGDPELRFDLVRRDLRGLIQSRSELSQVRFLDTTGQEIIRFNRKGERIWEVPDKELQNKSHRTYFEEHNSAPRGTIGYTSIELNIENGAPSYPYSLVTRWMVPVFDHNGIRRGMIIANVSFNEVMWQSEKLLNSPNRRLLVRNHEGVISYDSKVYTGESADSLSEELGNPDWSQEGIQVNSAGMFISDQYYDFRDIIEENQGDINIPWAPSAEVRVQFMSFTSRRSYLDKVHADMPYIFVIQTFLVLLVGFFAYRWARFRLLEEFNYRELIGANKALRRSQIELSATKEKLEELVKDQELQINRNQRLLSTLFDSSVHYAGVMDTSGTMVDINKKTLDTVGLPKELVVGKKIWDFEVFGDKERVRLSMLEAIKRAINGEKVSFESTMLDRSGSIRRIGFSLSPIYPEEGEIQYLIPEGMDITELREKDRQLQEVIRQMETRNKQLKEFSHIISHNVRSPIGNLGLLLSILDDAENEEERQEIIDKLNDVNSSLQSLLEELLETVKILDNASIRTEMTRIEPALKQARTLLSRQIEESQAEIHIDVSKAPVVYFPKVYLNSLILNLMSNAIKYRSLERPLVLNIYTELNNNRVELHFEDNGSGIDLKKHGHKVFGLYKTFDRSRPGKGLGLFMTRTQIESSGGTIQIKSKVDVGTTFIVTFPSAPDEL